MANAELPGRVPRLRLQPPAARQSRNTTELREKTPAATSPADTPSPYATAGASLPVVCCANASAGGSDHAAREQSAHFRVVQFLPRARHQADDQTAAPPATSRAVVGPVPITAAAEWRVHKLLARLQPDRREE